MALNVNSRPRSKNQRKVLQAYNKKAHEAASLLGLPNILQAHPTKGFRIISRKRIETRNEMLAKFGFVR